MARSLVLVFAALLAAAVAPGCTCAKTEPSAEDAAPAATVEAPVPTPDGLLADLFVATPNATWQKAQRGIGGSLGILPAALGGIVCALGGLDPSLGAEIDGTAPVTGALADDATGVAWALAMKISEPRRARDLLFEAETARYTPRAVAGMTLLAPKGGGSLSVVAALANGGYLVLARSEADLAKLGPYAYRTLPKKKAPTDGALVVDADAAALKGPLRARLAAMWDGTRGDLASKDDASRAAHGGRAPDYADPKAVLSLLDGAIQTRLAIMSDLARARLVVDVLEGSLRAELFATPAEGAGPATATVAAMHPGDGAPLLDGADTPLALLFRDDQAGRAQTGADVEDAVKKALGERMAEPEAKRLHAAVDAWTKARGDWTTLGLVGQDGLFLRAPVTSPDAADRAIKDALGLVAAPPLKQGLHIQDVSVGAGTAQIAYGEPAGKGAGPRKANVAWAAKAGEFSLTVTTPAAAAQPVTTKKLGDEPAIVAAVQALGQSVTFAAVAQPLKLDPARALSPAAPVVLAWGKKESGGVPVAYARIEATHPLVRELLRMRMGL